MKARHLAPAIALTCITIARAQQPAPPPLTFDDKGAKLGEQLPDVALTNLDKTTTSLGRQVYSHPTLFVTSSYTCPKSRSNYPALAALADKYADDVDVVIIYVIEAHPAGDPSPYRDGKEDVTDQNKQDNILLRQPQKLDRRLEYASSFKDKFKAKMPILVDGMDNLVWKSLGAGPNMAVLVDENRVVIARQGWFDAAKMEVELQSVIKTIKDTPKWPQFGYSGPSAEADTALALTIMKDENVTEFEMSGLVAGKSETDISRLLIKYPALLNFVQPFDPRADTGGETFLQSAIRLNKPAVAKLMLEKGADPEILTENRPPTLHLAAAAGQTELIQMLLPYIKHVDLRQKNGPTALQLALLNDHPDAAALLSKAGAHENFFTHAAHGDLDYVKKALTPDPGLAWRPDGAGQSPLAYAAGAGQTEMCKALVAAGAPAKMPEDGRDLDPLTKAVAQKHLATAQWLIEAGADPKWTILIGEATGDPKMVQMLLKHGADRDMETSGGWNALHLAARDGDIALMQSLLDAGIPINKETGFLRGGCGPGGDYSNMITPLQAAAGGEHPEAVAFLLAHGADVTATDVDYQSALVAALTGGQEKKPDAVNAIVKLLIEAKIAVNEEDSAGKTALDWAISAKLAGAEKLLRNAGAKVGSGKPRGVKSQKSDKPDKPDEKK